MAKHVKEYPPKRLLTPLEGQLLLLLCAVVVVIVGMILKQQHL